MKLNDLAFFLIDAAIMAICLRMDWHLRRIERNTRPGMTNWTEEDFAAARKIVRESVNKAREESK